MWFSFFSLLLWSACQLDLFFDIIITILISWKRILITYLLARTIVLKSSTSSNTITKLITLLAHITTLTLVLVLIRLCSILIVKVLNVFKWFLVVLGICHLIHVCLINWLLLFLVRTTLIFREPFKAEWRHNSRPFS